MERWCYAGYQGYPHRKQDPVNEHYSRPVRPMTTDNRKRHDSGNDFILLVIPVQGSQQQFWEQLKFTLISSIRAWKVSKKGTTLFPFYKNKVADSQNKVADWDNKVADSQNKVADYKHGVRRVNLSGEHHVIFLFCCSSRKKLPTETCKLRV